MLNDPKFMDWLREQHDRKDLVGKLAKIVRSDPRAGNLRGARDLSQRLNLDEADYEMYEALDQANDEFRQETLH